jgi:hypothetical protein
VEFEEYSWHVEYANKEGIEETLLAHVIITKNNLVAVQRNKHENNE